jgi:pilus assembly protein TadC
MGGGIEAVGGGLVLLTGRASTNQLNDLKKDHNIYYNVILATFAATLLFNYKLALKTFKWEPLINYFFLNVLPSIYLIYYLFFFVFLNYH